MNSFQSFTHERHWDEEVGHVMYRLVIKQWYGAGTILFRRANSLHRLEIPINATEETWTLFITGKKVREWGFLSKEGWIWHRNYNKEGR
jgi:hypothetical protein